ncbi:MAG: glycosyltransferase [Tepidisphaeraceae bacterium]
MRVLLISHTCQSITEGQPKAHGLAALSDITLRVLVPDRWRRYGQWRAATAPKSAAFEYQIAKVRLPWAGPAQAYLHYYPAIPAILQEFKPDVIDVWEEPWGLVSVQICRLRKRLLPAAKIVSETEQNIDKKLPPPFEQFRSHTLAHADFAVGRSAEAVAVLRHKGYAGPAEVVPNAVDADLFRPLDRIACRREFGLCGFVIGYAGRLVPEKGLADLIDALALCPSDVNLILIGSGPLNPWLEAQRQSRGLGDRLRIIPSLPLEKLPPLMNAMDALILPSRTTPSWKEQFGRVLIEAQSCATPIIGTRSGAIPDVIGAAGLVVPEQDPAALAGAIRFLRDNAGESRRLGEIGRQQVLAHFTWQRVAQRMHDIYLKVLG